MSGMRLAALSETAAVAGWPGVRSLFRPGWTSFSTDRVSVYHYLSEDGIGPSVEVTTYVDGAWIDRSTLSFMLEQMRVHKGPPREDTAAITYDGAPAQWSVLRSSSAWVAVSEDLPQRVTIVAREFPIAAVHLERVAVSALDGHARLTAAAS